MFQRYKYYYPLSPWSTKIAIITLIMFSYYLKSEQDAQYILQIFNDLIFPKLIESRNNLTEGSIVLLLNDMG